MLSINKTMQKLLIIFLMTGAVVNMANAQVILPTWWFGVSGAANFNWYDGVIIHYYLI